MIAFIGVRISWLIAARNVLLARSASSAASGASCASRKSRAFSIAIAACWASPTSKSRSVWLNGSPGHGRQTAIDAGHAVVGDERRDHQPLFGRQASVPGIVDAYADPCAASLTNSGRRAAR